MLYSSTRGIDKNRCFKEVLLKGLAEDGGLYVPEKLKVYNYNELRYLKSLDYANLAYEVTKYFISGDIPADKYKKICKKTYEKAFGSKIISIHKLNEKEFISNLHHGPTFAFKDFALQLLGNIYDYILKKEKKNLQLSEQHLVIQALLQYMDVHNQSI